MALECWHPFIGQNGKVYFRSCNNPVYNGCRMTSVEGLILDFQISNISWQPICVGFGDIRSARLLNMFALVAPRNLRPFFIQMFHITHCYPVHMPPKRWIRPAPRIPWKMLPFMAPNLFSLSVIAPDVVIFFISLLKMTFTVRFSFDSFLLRS